MKANQLRSMTAVLALLAGSTLALANPTLKIGDAAPKLQTGTWVQGEPVKEFEKDKAYIVEFWATWCGPCRVSIPHLNETYQKYKDKGLIVIGQDCWERDDELVAPFVKKMDDKMTYRVALDDKSADKKGKMAVTWMEAAGRNGIPSAFLVDKTGVIAWLGHPMELKETTIDAVLAGTFDVKEAAVAYEKAQRDQEKLTTTFNAMNRAIKSKDWDTAEAKLNEAQQLLPEDQRDNLAVTHFNLLIDKQDYPAAYKLAAATSDAHPDNAMIQNEIAWKIATDKSITQRDLDVAEKLARRAVEATKSKDAGILDTLARVTFMQGKKDEAIAIQQSAVNLAEGDAKTSLQQALDSYKKGELTKSN
jgi:thiol-disulfide isomerase/thioredoxin